MKKNCLNVANLGATEILTREQLKSIFGGGTGSSGSGSGSGSSGSDPCDRPGFPCNAACYTSTINTGICRTQNSVCTCVSVS